MTAETSKKARGTRACAWAKWLFIIGAILLVAGLLAPGLGASPMIAMLLVSLGLLLFIVAAICGAIGLIRSNGSGGASSALFAWLGVVAGVAAIINVSMTMSGAGGAPIHDISTDTDDPPAFVEVAKLRGPDENPAEYSGPETAAIQKQAYPDIEPLLLPDSPGFVFDVALQVARDMGWEIVASNAETGIIEATATTPFVGFKDDVVIRIRSQGPKAIVDVRSKSRIGRGDMGVNAKRVRAFSEKLVTAAEP